MLGKINVLKIIGDHLKTLKSLRTGKVLWSEIALFFILPLGVSIYSVYFQCFSFDSGQVNILIASLSILAGFLFNLLAMIFGAMDKLKENANGDDIKLALVREIHINVSFSILLSVICIILLLFYDCKIGLLKPFFNMMALFVIISFFLTLLMVLKRIYIIMSKDLN
jgi:hypothetical protein